MMNEKNTNAEKTLEIDGKTFTYSQVIERLCIFCHKFMDEDEKSSSDNNFTELSNLIVKMRLNLEGSNNPKVKNVVLRAYELYVDYLLIEWEEFAESLGMTADELSACGCNIENDDDDE